MLRICIAGLTDSGKTTVGNMLSKELNIMHITKYGTSVYKDFKNEDHSKDETYNILQTSNKKYAESFDNEVKTLSKNNNCVVSTWIGPWIVEEPKIKVWLNAPLDERIKRCSLERKLSMEDAVEYVKKKDEVNTKVFMDLYNININDHSDFDIEINTSRSKIEETVALITMLALEREKMTFR